MQPEHSPLGKTSTYVTEYDPALLFPIPRKVKRDEIGVPSVPPFFGSDFWNGYELSWLNLRGKPVVAIAAFVVPADTPNIIESKSFKLYLNSFNQTRITSIEELQTRLETDLSAAAGGRVGVHLYPVESFAQQRLQELEGYCIDNLDIEVDHYQLDPAILRLTGDEDEIEETLVSHLLKSNCLVTGQPDWASVQIRYRGRAIDRESLLRYLISFRQHNEFHEQCVERIFMDLQRYCDPRALSVYARYTRRGGLDINPFRTNFTGPAPQNIRSARQ
ncbi:NADPH-dependent 7-cyano-7-deazaguanine reductase QueF [Burkholderiaceae bacterium DAT-1]|nr:NADPH-dependent 7-cyano-7-deazaguanine reductase QueF [Burkholderiaceae bacterium DAT-1]